MVSGFGPGAALFNFSHAGQLDAALAIWVAKTTDTAGGDEDDPVRQLCSVIGWPPRISLSDCRYSVAEFNISDPTRRDRGLDRDRERSLVT
jgi:hypothetical protein